jgi:hypothetical protein
MPKFNGDIVFIDTSGQIYPTQGDLTLRANFNGDGHVVIGSGISLRPEVDCDASDAMDLGQDGLRWKTLFACSGNFLERLTVNSSGIQLRGEGVDSINGFLGVVTITSPDGSILVGDGPQAIELSGLFTAASGALLEQHSDDLITLSGLIGSGGGGSVSGFAAHTFIASDSTGNSVESLNLMESDETNGPGLTLLKTTRFQDVAVDFLHDGALEGGDWTLELQKYVDGSGYITQSTFTVATE